MANNNLPKKLTFWNKLKIVFSNNSIEKLLQSNNALRGQISTLNARISTYESRENNLAQREDTLAKETKALNEKKADLLKRETAISNQEADLAKRATAISEKERELEEKLKEAKDAITFAEPIARKQARAYADSEIARIQNEADRKVSKTQAEADQKVAQAQAESEDATKKAEEAMKQAKAKEAEANKVLENKVSSGEITAGKGEQGALMTVFFEKYIIEATEKLKADIAELKAIGGNPQLKQSYIANYQADLLGTLLAYMEFDTITKTETKKLIETKIQEAIIHISNKYPETRKTFVKSFICTKYQAYDGNLKNEIGEPYKDLDSFLDKNHSNNSYFEGKVSHFTDPITINTQFVDSYYSSPKVVELKPSDHFLPRTDFSSHEFRVDPTLKVKQHSELPKEENISYTPDLSKVVESKIPEEFEIR